MTAQLPETPPDRRDASAQGLADRMAPFVSDAGFGAEWALFGPAIVEQHIDAAFEAILVALGEPTPKHVTLRYDLATGESSLTEVPGQREHRIILDGSNERNRLTAFRSFCRLFCYREQRALALASKVLIVTAPLDEWIVENEPHPEGACDGLQIIIILPPPGFPPFDDSGHHDDCRLAAHVAVVKARGKVGKSTLLLVSKGGSDFGDLDGALAEFLASRPPQDIFRVELSAASFLENWLLPWATENVMLLISAHGHVLDWPRGVETIELFATGEPTEHWRDVLSKLHQEDGRRRSAQIVSISAFRKNVERPLRAQRPKWLH